jgi:type VI secretion system secreted protein VgrG
MSIALTAQITTALAQFSSATRLYALTLHDDTTNLSEGLLVEAFVADEEVHGIGGRDVIVVSTNAHVPLEPLLGQHAALEVTLANGSRTRFSGAFEPSAQLPGMAGGDHYRHRRFGIQVVFAAGTMALE